MLRPAIGIQYLGVGSLKFYRRILGPIALFQQMSVLDLWLPGFANITSPVSQTLGGNTSGFAHLVCIFAILLAFFRPHESRLGSWLMKYFGESYRLDHSDLD